MAKDLTYPNGVVKATFFKKLSVGECPCKWDKYPEKYIVKGKNVYKKVNNLTTN